MRKNIDPSSIVDPTRTKRAKEHLARLAKSKGKRLLVDLDASGREALDALLGHGYGKSQREVVIKSLCAAQKSLSQPLT